MQLAVLALAYCSCFGVATVGIAGWRRLFGSYPLWQAPANFAVAAVMCMEAMRGGWIFHLFFVGVVYCIAAVGAVTLVAVALNRRAGRTEAWILSTLPAALCALTIQRVPDALSAALAVISAVAGTLCFITWLKTLPKAPGLQPSQGPLEQ